MAELAIITFDLSDPAHPRPISELTTASTFYLHWLGADPGSDRIVVTEQGDGPPRVMMARLNRTTGRLPWDERFRDPDSSVRGVNFARKTWPSGITGTAIPHAASFVP